VEFEWDERKRKSNLNKHKIDFADAEIVFSGTVITIPDERKDYDEVRWFSLGLLEDVVVAVSHTDRDERIRIISMRKAERYESEIYFTQIISDTEAKTEDAEAEDGQEDVEGDEEFGD
jgi:uncharacterized protein